VPPRAQAAHQQSTHLAGQLPRKLAGQAPTPWRYRDFGSLVSLGEYSTVGSLMGKLVGRSLLIEGYFARLMYVSLYKMHEYALHGFIKMAARNSGAPHQSSYRTAGETALTGYRPAALNALFKSHSCKKAFHARGATKENHGG